MHQTRIGSWGSAPDPDGGACSTPPYLLAGSRWPPLPHLPPAGLSQFHTNPASGSVCPTIHTCIILATRATAWLSPLITCFAPPPPPPPPPPNTQPGYGPGIDILSMVLKYRMRSCGELAVPLEPVSSPL